MKNYITHLSKQHDEIKLIIEKLKNILVKELILEDTYLVQLRLKQFNTALSRHLAIEDVALYPQLRRTNNPLLRETIEKLSTEVGELDDKVHKHYKKWQKPEHILLNPDLFIQQTQLILQESIYRITQEDTYLYPLLNIKY